MGKQRGRDGGRARRAARFAACAAAGALAVALLPACSSVKFKAARATVLIRDHEIVYTGPADEAALVGGETVLTLRNDGTQRHRIVLAETDVAPDRLPAKLRTARQMRDDARIKGVTKDLKPKEAALAGGGLGFILDADSFHVYLRPGRTYLLYDSLAGGVANGVHLAFLPSAQGRR